MESQRIVFELCTTQNVLSWLLLLRVSLFGGLCALLAFALTLQVYSWCLQMDERLKIVQLGNNDFPGGRVVHYCNHCFTEKGPRSKTQVGLVT